MVTAEDPSLWFFAMLHVNIKFLVTSLEGLFWTPSDRISHCIYILMTSCSQLPAGSGIFCLLVRVVYWSCGLKFVYPMINLAFLMTIVKVKLPTKFCLQFRMILSSNKWYKILFPLLSKALWFKINSHYSILLSNLKQKRT